MFQRLMSESWMFERWMLEQGKFEYSMCHRKLHRRELYHRELYHRDLMRLDLAMAAIVPLKADWVAKTISWKQGRTRLWLSEEVNRNSKFRTSV